GVLYWRDDCFWHFINAPGYEFQPTDTEQIVASGLPLMPAGKAPLLIDRRHSYSPSLGAVKLLARIAPSFFTAIAYYAPTEESRIASRLVRDLFLRDLPVAIFRNEDEAVRWLKTFVGVAAQPPIAPIRVR